jgi:hypothetical protein
VDKQNWLAASENTGGRPGRPSRSACQALSLSSQINSDPRVLSPALQSDPFVVRWRAGLGFLMPPI